jgi:hypothetical protein
MYNSLESFLLQVGFSWTAAKFTPYVLTLVLGYLFFWLISKLRIKTWLKLSLMALGFCLPFMTYFAFYPIYEADLQTKTFKPLQTGIDLPKAKTLVLVILPGCPYCMETIELSKKMVELNPKINIQYLLASEDQEGFQYFRKRLPSNIGVKRAQNSMLCMLMAQGEFPSYFLVADGKVKTAWHNTQFGVRALDQINSFF